MQNFHEPCIPEKQLIEELKTILKQQGYLKNRKYWHKELNDIFILRFHVQTSFYDHTDYDVRVGVSVKIPWLEYDNSVDGYFSTIIPVVNGLQVYHDSVEYFRQWTDWKVLREKMLQLKEWRDKYPAEYLRTLPREKKVKPPCEVPFGEPMVVKYILSDEFKEKCERLIGDKQLEISDDKVFFVNGKNMLVNDGTDWHNDNVKYCLLCGKPADTDSVNCPNCHLGIVVNKYLYGMVYNTMTQRNIEYVDKVENSATINSKNKNYLNALNKLATEYYLAQNYNFAIPLFMQSAILGNAEAQSLMGFCYEKGESVVQSYEKASEWYTKSAKQGYACSLHNLGILYLNGYGVKKDYNKAIKFLKKSWQAKVS